ncbi:MAG: glycosyltransferase [Pseudomonadota bacterium]
MTSDVRGHVVVLATHIAEGRLDAFETAFSGLSDELRAQPRIQFQMCRYLHARGHHDECLSVALLLIADDPCFSAARGMAIRACAETGAFADAFALILEAPADGLNCDWAFRRLFILFSRSTDSTPEPLAAMRRIAETKGAKERLWLARLHRWAGDLKQADALIEAELAERPEDLDARIELADIRLAALDWHRGARLFEELLDEEDVPPDLKDRMGKARDCVTHLDRWYRSGPPVAADYRLPDSLFERVALSPRVKAVDLSLDRVALVGATMAAGGAENILGQAFGALRAGSRFQPELWLYSANPEKGHDFFLDQLAIRQDEERGVFIVPNEEPDAPPHCWLPFSPGRHVQGLRRMIARRRPAILHGWQDGVNLEVAMAGLLAGVPKILLHAHNMRADSVHRTKFMPSFRRAYRALLRRPETHLICVSEASLADYLDWLDIDREARFHVVHNGLRWPDPMSFADREARRRAVRSEYGFKRGDRVIGGIFRFFAIKRPMLWIEVAARLARRDPRARFLLFGNGPEWEETKCHAGRLGVADKIRFAGVVADAGALSIAFDALLLTSESEGLPTVILEAQGNGVPVVAGDVGGVGECIWPGHAVLVPSSDPAAFAAALSDVLDRPRDPARTEACIAGIRQTFSIAAMTAKLEAIYRQ